jgi:uncharacterized protein (TIGR00255 family)
MIKSMTGFGKTELELPNKKITIEIKTLNSRQTDLNTRVPNIYRIKELEIRALLSNKLVRGKIDFNIYVEHSGENFNYSINKGLANQYYKAIKDLATELNQPNFSNYLPIILKMPDVMKTEKEDFDEEEWKIIEKLIVDALIQVDEFRTQEGQSLESEFTSRINTILNLLEAVTPYEEARINQVKKRLMKNLNEFKEDVKFDQNRFEQEMIYYIEKIDITEEKVRLKKHCDYFLENLNDESAGGKKLNFISQEIGREINTLGSKANDVNLQKIVIQMKDELEKIKEQLFNIL